MSKMFKVITVVDRTSQVGALARAALEEALEDITEDCLTEANRTVPHGEGMLQDSGFAEVDGLEGQVAYSTPYAVKQHEDPTLRHDAGRRDHWLSQAVEENWGRWEDWLRDKAAARLR